MYISLDIETTGLRIGVDKVIEVGAIIDIDGRKPVEQLPKFHACLEQEYLEAESETIAWRMNRKLIESIQEGTAQDIMEPSELGNAFNIWLITNGIEPEGWLCAGKNVGTFDIPFLNTVTNQLKPHRRFLDVGSKFWRIGESVVPGLGDCAIRAEYTGRVDHTALGDAALVIECLRRAGQ